MTADQRFCISLVLAGAAFFACTRTGTGATDSHPSAPSIQVKGSDTMVNLVQAWAEKYISLHADFNLGITGGGSGTGIAALLNHSCDIAMSSRPMEDKELVKAKAMQVEPREFIVGLDGLMVVVHPSNPVDNLSLDQVRDIFIGKTRNWRGVGGEDRQIVILSRESNSGTHVFFKEHILKRGDKKSQDEFSPHSLLMPSSQAIVNELIQNPHCIGYVGMGYQSPRLKALDIEGIAPSIENVVTGVYPVSRPLYLYTDGSPAAAVKDFLDFALSAQGQTIVRETDFVPVGHYEKNT